MIVLAGHVYVTAEQVQGLLGVTPALLRQWKHDGLLDSDDRRAPGAVRDGRINRYRLDVVREVEWRQRTAGRGRPRAA